MIEPPRLPTSALTITHHAVGCIVAGKFPRFEAQFDPAEAVGRGRVRFRPEGGQHWYSVPVKAPLS